MNPGAFVFQASLFSAEDLAEAAELAHARQAEQRPVHEAGKYGDIRWFQVKLDETWPVARKMLDALGAKSPELLVFYYLEPGAVLHPHRDLTGASLNDRLRFHVPVITNPQVDFRVNGERIVMKPGDMWCLDTSYLHSVRNDGTETRVHMIVECKITDKIRARIPRGLSARLHSARYAAILAGSFAKALVVNSIKDPKYFRQQMGMVAKFIGWRFLGIGKAR